MRGSGYKGGGQSSGEPPMSGSSVGSPPARLIVSLTEAELRAIIREEIAKAFTQTVRRAGGRTASDVLEELDRIGGPDGH